MNAFLIRVATMADTQHIDQLIQLSSRTLGLSDYTSEQIEGALRDAWGLDTQLIIDKTYYVVELRSALTQLEIKNTDHFPAQSVKPASSLVGCGGWSFRETLFGNDAEQGRNENLIDPHVGAAKIRAFFVHPHYARQGIANLMMERCEQSARVKGFSKLELMSTLPGERFYRQHQFLASDSIDYPLDDTLSIKFVPMSKSLLNE